MLLLKAVLENKEEVQEMFVSLAAAKEIRIGAVITTALSELDGIFTLQVEQTVVLKAFLIGRHVLALLPIDRDHLVTHCTQVYCSSPQDGEARLALPLTIIGIGL